MSTTASLCKTLVKVEEERKRNFSCPRRWWRWTMTMTMMTLTEEEREKADEMYLQGLFLFGFDNCNVQRFRWWELDFDVTINWCPSWWTMKEVTLPRSLLLQLHVLESVSRKKESIFVGQTKKPFRLHPRKFWLAFVVWLWSNMLVSRNCCSKTAWKFVWRYRKEQNTRSGLTEKPRARTSGHLS